MTKFNKLNNRRKKKLAKRIIAATTKFLFKAESNEHVAFKFSFYSQQKQTPIPNVTDPVKTLRNTKRFIELMNFYK